MTTPMTTEQLAAHLLISPDTRAVSPAVTEVAKAGYAAFHRSQQVRPWEQLHGMERKCWQLAAELVWDDAAVTVVQLRLRYHMHTEQPDWSDLSAPYRQQWMEVATAMRGARIRVLMAERMVVSG